MVGGLDGPRRRLKCGCQRRWWPGCCCCRLPYMVSRWMEARRCLWWGYAQDDRIGLRRRAPLDCDTFDCHAARCCSGRSQKAAPVRLPLLCRVGPRFDSSGGSHDKMLARWRRRRRGERCAQLFASHSARSAPPLAAAAAARRAEPRVSPRVPLRPHCATMTVGGAVGGRYLGFPTAFAGRICFSALPSTRFGCAARKRQGSKSDLDRLPRRALAGAATRRSDVRGCGGGRGGGQRRRRAAAVWRYPQRCGAIRSGGDVAGRGGQGP